MLSEFFLQSMIMIMIMIMIVIMIMIMMAWQSKTSVCSVKIADINTTLDQSAKAQSRITKILGQISWYDSDGEQAQDF